MQVCIKPAAADQPVIPVSVATLIPETIPTVSLYLNAETDSFRLYRGPEHPITAEDIANLRKRGISKLYVAVDEHRKYQEYLRRNLDHILGDESIPTERRVECLNGVVRDVLDDLFRRGHLDTRIEQLKELGEKTVRAVCGDGVVFRDLGCVLYHDYHTFAHSANVALYSALLAWELGIRDRAELAEIATGGLLHDAGKLDVPPAILNKPGRLDEVELQVMRQHPTLGFRKLCHRADLSLGQLMMVYQHHEHVDGSGYPGGFVADELHDWGRICAVADVFEALTSNRPYRAALTVEESCRMMDAKSGTAFDREYLRCWIQFVSKT